MDPKEFAALMQELRARLAKLQETGFLRRTHPDGSFFLEDCDPTVEGFPSAGRSRSESAQTASPLTPA